MKLWIGNIAPGTTDAELTALVKKYAHQLECTAVQRVEGDGSRPAAVLQFADAPMGVVEQVSMRLNGMYWKERELISSALSRM